jgi:hypothetical protein
MKKMMASVALLAGLMLPAVALADSEAWDFTTAGTAYTNGNWTFGSVFTPTQNIELTFLGYYAANGVGSFTSDHPVGIFDASGTLLSETDITNASTFTTGSGHFAFNPVTPLELFAGDTYVLEGVSNSDDYTWDDVGFIIYAPITDLGDNWIADNGLNFNGTDNFADVSDGWWGPNFGYTDVTTPEPSSLILLGSGLVGFAGALRRKFSR